LIANSWDGDADKVDVLLPEVVNETAEIIIRDDGVGMTFQECQDRYLNVGYNRRQDDPTAASARGRPVLGRKGIGKFAGFGIAAVIEITTISAETGERTKFSLKIDELRGDGDEYVGTSPREITGVEYDGPDDARRKDHGTTIRLHGLSLSRRPSPSVFLRSMGRRFLLMQRAADFRVTVNGTPIDEAVEDGKIEFEFPRDYKDEERPSALVTEDDGWGLEKLSNDEVIRWKVIFYEDPIADEELVGVAIYARGKLAQTPFAFNLAGGLGGQHGQSYLSGKVEADYLDEKAADLIATERQRINWDDPATEPLLDWGQDRVKTLLRIWRERRAEGKVRLLEERLAPFADRVDRLPASEKKTIKRALTNIAKLPSLSNEQFEDLCQSILTAWEGGRLRELIDQVADAGDLSEEALLKVLVEAKVLTALHAAESVKAKLLVIEGLHHRVERRELENAVRDYIAENPWLIDPQWETFRKEISVKKLMAAAKSEAGLDEDHGWPGRVDLALSGGRALVVLEFMRPDVKIDWDHVSRFERYVLAMRNKITATTGGQFDSVYGYLVADELDSDATVMAKLVELAKQNMVALDWESLLARAAGQWRDFFSVLLARAPEDERLAALAKGMEKS
jgi:hypothetical protein